MAKHAASGQGGRDAAQLATFAAEKTPKKTAEGKPSTVGHTVGGAATGAALGTAIGGPGVGTAVGAAIGGGAGALKGHKAKESWKAAQRGDGAGARRALIAEFLVCIVILALSPLSRPVGEVKAADWMKRGSAMCGVFILLGMVSSIGPRTARAATALGGLIALALLLDQREVFGVIADRMRQVEGDQGDDQGDDPDDEVPDDGRRRGGGRF